MPTRQGAIRLFRFSGIDVFLHWSWFLIAIYEINGRHRVYSSIAWNILEYLGLFLIVTLHEFGHALACRQVGGVANQIVLWPLGGVAYVNPPPRPGATLWSIAAGPLVNLVLAPVLFVALKLSRASGLNLSAPDIYVLVRTLYIINIGLFVFNIMPIYPLDGGQILRSLLWFIFGRARSLMIATVLGFIGVAGFFLLAFVRHSTWMGIIAVFILLNCWSGLQHARALLRFEKLPRHQGFACPSCKASPPIGNYWKCARCGQPFDTFQSHAVCPHCSANFEVTQCLDCGNARPMHDWSVAAVAPSRL
jgi:Zn-dependent protease